jgi:hypothetical protein
MKIRLLLAMAFLAASGCSKSAVSQLRASTPAEAAAKAFELHDADSNGQLDSDELSKCASINAALDRIDTNRDKAIDRAELEARFTAHDELADVVAFDVRITHNREPLVGAMVTFTPEPFMGEGKQPYVGTTVDGGTCYVLGQEVELPGVPVGFYQVHIVHPPSTVDVTLGGEVAGDAPTANRMSFDVDAKRDRR